MSGELKDLRAKVTCEAYSFLEARQRVTGVDISAQVRDILHAWALDQLRVATVAHRLLQSEGMVGIVGEPKGASGNKKEKG